MKNTPPVKRYRGQRGPQKTPTKVQVTIRLDAAVVNYYRDSGPGWQGRLNADLLVSTVRRITGVQDDFQPTQETADAIAAYVASQRSPRRTRKGSR